MPELENDDAEIRVATDAPDPNAVVINGGDGPRAENERVQNKTRQTVSRDAPERGDRDPSRRIEDEGDEAYSELVRRRIGKEVAKRRAAELEVYQLKSELSRASGEARSASEASLTHYEQAALARLDSAKRDASDAYDSGDGQKVVEANRKLASAQIAVDNVESIKARREQERTDNTRQGQPDPAARPAPQARFTPRTQEWVDDNSWFETDPEAHAQAIKIHDRLKREGFEIESPEYFAELTKRSRVLFPEHFSEDEAPRRRREAEDDGEAVLETPVRRQTPVAGVTRTPSTTTGAGHPKRVQEVKLTPAQYEAAAIAGVSPTKYAEKMIALRGAGKLR